MYIVFTLVCMPGLLGAKSRGGKPVYHEIQLNAYAINNRSENNFADTVKTLRSTNKANDTKVKEVAKARRQPMPQKVDNNNQGDATKDKNKRQRRPDGMERPPEIPRRNDN